MSDLTDLRKRAAQQSQTGNYWAGKVMALVDELMAARQALWDVYGILGFDQDGDKTPAAVKDLENLVRNAATGFRKDYDDALDEIPDAAVALARMATDTGARHRLEDVMTELGITQADLDAVEDDD